MLTSHHRYGFGGGDGDMSRQTSMRSADFGFERRSSVKSTLSSDYGFGSQGENNVPRQNSENS